MKKGKRTHVRHDVESIQIRKAKLSYPPFGQGGVVGEDPSRTLTWPDFFEGQVHNTDAVAHDGEVIFVLEAI